MKKSFIAIASPLLMLTATALAQTTAEITGRITDVSNAIVPGTAVKVINIDKRIERTAASNDQGYYTVGNLDPGNYEVSVQAAGFKAVTRKGISLDVNQSVRLDFALQVGEVTERIEVVEHASVLESATAQLGTLMSEEKIADLPLNARNFTQLLSLTPGASPVSVAQNAGGGQTTAPIGVLVFPAINGQTNRSNSFTLDGVYNNGHFTGTYDIAPNVDALNEFKVQSHSDLAEFGGVSGGVINIATKSGGNAFHGSAYEFLRNDKLDARGFFTAKNPPLRQNQFGATVGGPIVRNKTFFFFSYEGFRQIAGSSQLSSVPTPDQIAGNFAGSAPIFDAWSTRVDPANANRFLRDPFPNNQIPAARLSPSIQAFAAAIIPKPVSTGFAGFNALNTDSQTFPGENYSIRVDHYLSSRDWIWGRYNRGHGDQSQALTLPGTVDAKRIPAENLGVSYTHNFSSNTVMNVLFGFTSTTFFDAPTFTNQDLISKGFFKGFPADPRTFVPGVTIPGYFSLSMRNRKLGPQQGFQYHADFAHNTGRHNLKFGAEMVAQPWTNTQITDLLTFSNRTTADLNNLGATGNTLASFMTGLMDQTQLNIADFSLTSHLWAFYAQDSWKVTDKLTVNFGLRWDAAPAPTFWRDFPSTWDFHTGKFLVGAPKPAACSTGVSPCLVDPNNAYVTSNVTFLGTTKLRADELRLPGPRLGMAYRLGSKTVLRGSFGIFYDLMAGVNQQAQNGNINNAGWPGFKGATPNSNATVVTATADAPFGTANAATALPAASPAAVTANFFDPRFQNPYSLQWNVEVQREFTRGISLSAGYVGSHTVRLSIAGDYNTALYPAAGPITARQLFPLDPVTLYDRSIGQSKYNALQINAERRLAGGLSFIMAYSWSKSIDVASSGQFTESISNQNAYDPNSSRAVSGFDVPHLFSVATIYALPFGHGKPFFNHGVASRVFGNWQINGIVQARTGQPFTPVTNLDIANVGALEAASRDRPDLIGNPNLANPTPSLWFNKAAFKAPAQFTYGSAGRNILRSANLRDVDLSLFREDRLTERIKLQFRAESFNLLNHPTFDVPQTTLTSPTFGVVSGTIANARQIQLGLKVLF